jgi:hypothetical protein
MSKTRKKVRISKEKWKVFGLININRILNINYITLNKNFFTLNQIAFSWMKLQPGK